MANGKQLAILKKGVEQWNRWKRATPNVEIDLSGANLSDADLSYVDLSYANLDGAVLHNVNLTEANLYNANLSKADLTGEAKLWQAVLKRAKLNGANLSKADLSGANLIKADFNGANLSDANLSETIMVETHLENATLDGCRVYGISAWNLNLDSNTKQSKLIITRGDEATITVDNLQVAQFIYLLLSNEKIRDVIDTVAHKAVLILGRFTPERKAVLDTLREELRKRDYLPILFDFDKPATRNVRETVRTLAHLSRFIIADVTEPKSIPLELETIVPQLRVPVQPLLLKGYDEFSMFVDLRETYHWVLATHQYTDINDLLASLSDKVIAPAEQKAKELEKR